MDTNVTAESTATEQIVLVQIDPTTAVLGVNVRSEANLTAERYTVAAGDAIHAGICSKDAIVTELTGSTTKGKDHALAAKGLRQRWASGLKLPPRRRGCANWSPARPPSSTESR